MFNTG